jgi:ligand-binding sensor domain-containing protein
MKKYQIRTKTLTLLSKLKKTKTWTSVSFILLGIASTIWFLARVIPKPSRTSYPCMRAAAPFMSGLVVYLLSIGGSALAIKWFRKNLAASKYFAATALFVTAFVMIVIANVSTRKEANAAKLLPASYFKANAPIGIPSGLKPGRVVWIWNRNATNEDFVPSDKETNWWAKQTKGSEVEKMLQKAVMKYSDKNSVTEAWDALFKYFNEQHGKGAVGYTPGEKIYIKLNITNSASGSKKTRDFDRMDSTPELALSLLKQLIEEVGVAQSDICIGDPFRRFHNLYWDMCHSVYPNVVYCDGTGIDGRHQTVPTAEHAMFFSDKKLAYRIPQEYVDAAYFINMPCLKTHNEGGITLGAKNHQGSILQDGARPSGQSAQGMHYSLPANDEGFDNYRHLVDYLGHKDLGGKTLLTIIDGIWAGVSWEGFIEKWNMPPFNGDYPSSLFISQDRVAIDAVCYDFLLEEYKNKPSDLKYPYYVGTDDYLIQAADPSKWPAGITYDPEGDGTPLTSMGVYEHWDNPIDKNYSKNLGTGNGIELVKVNIAAPFTPDNSGLISPKVNKIFVDSFDVKWFGTDKGISRWDGNIWTLIDTSNYLRENTVNDILYEKTKYGDEIWVATNGGLSVMSFNVDGVTSATTYYVGGKESGIISDTITALGLDKNHVRWIATPKGINTFGKNGWDTLYTYIDYNRETQDWNGMIVNSIGSYERNGSVYMGTSGHGIINSSYSTVDGFTGASAMSSDWSGFWSDTVNSVTIYDTIQWYGTTIGAAEHFGNYTKEYWDHEIASWEVLINPVVNDIEKDNAGNIWLGTAKGLNILTSEGMMKYGSAIQTSNISINPTSITASISWDNGNGFSKILFNENVNDIQKDFSGNVWVASDSGVESYNYLPGVPLKEEAKRVVFVSNTSSGSIAPVNGTTCTANSEFKKGKNIRIDNISWYCVYNGSGNTVNVSGLSPNSKYRVIAFEYYGEPGKEKYSLIKGENNPINFTTLVTGINDISKNKVSAFPIPFNDFVIVHFKSMEKNYHVTIYNMDGKIFKSEQLFDNNQRINTSDLAKGVYLMKITDGKTEEILKIVK